MESVDRQIAREARGIFAGACNPRAVARALVRAIDFATEHLGTPGARSCYAAAARLEMAHLCHLLGMHDVGAGDYKGPDGATAWTDSDACEMD